MLKPATALFLLLLALMPEADAMPNQIAFRHLGMEEGFFQTNITAMYQDETGAVWIAGSNGLSRYCGTLPEDIVTGDRQRGSLTRQRILAILGDRKGKIYVQQAPGIVAYDMVQETFRQIIPDSLLDGSQVTAMCMAADRVMAATRARLLVYDGEHVSVSVPSLDIGEVTSLVSTRDGGIFLGTLNNGLYRIAPSGKAEPVVRAKSKINALMEDSKGQLWVATRSEGIFIIGPDGTVRQLKHDPSDKSSLVDNYVRCICEDDQGTVWVGTMYGLDGYDPLTGRFHHYGKSDSPLYGLRNLTVECIMKDLRGTIWLGSYYTGVSCFNASHPRFNSIPIVSDNTTWTIVADMAVDGRGNLWAGTSDKGLYFYDRDKEIGRFYNTANSSLAGNNIKSVVYDPRTDGLWIGSFMGGLTYMDIGRGTFRHIDLMDGGRGPLYENTGIIHRLALCGDKLFAATYAGVYVYDTRRGTSELLGKQERIFDVMIDHDSTLFTVPFTNRLSVYRLREGHDPESLCQITMSANTINDLLEDSRGRIWIATRDGLMCFMSETCSLEPFSGDGRDDGRGYISALAETSSGKLLAGTETGITVIDTVSGNIIRYGADNGFPVVSMQNGCIVRHGSEVFMGGMNGIAVCDEGIFEQSPALPSIRFSRLAVNNRPVAAGDSTRILKQSMAYTHEISLRHRYSDFEIEFCPDDHINYYPSAYQYRLSGYNDVWLDAGRNNRIAYSNLPPGRYVLQVRARPPADSERSMISLRIRVWPPWYASVTAYIGYILLIIGITAMVIRYAYSRKLLYESLRFERRDKQQREQVTQWKLSFFTNISHEFRTPLTLILGQIDLILRSNEIPSVLSTPVQAVRRNAERMKMLIDELLDFRKQEQGYLKLKVSEGDLTALLSEICDAFRDYAVFRGIALEFNPVRERITAWYDAAQMQKVFYNLISNAFKHTPKGGAIRVGADVVSGMDADDRIVVAVSDTGSGIDPSMIDAIFERFYHYDANTADTGMGIGLSLAKSIVELHDGYIAVESEVGRGSTFTVSFPAGRGHFEGRRRVRLLDGDTELQGSAVLHFPPTGMPPETTQEFPNPEEKSDAKPTVLIVEDDDELRSMLVSLFSPVYTVTQARNGAEGFAVALERQPEIIVSDVMMPVETGYELCEKIKSNFETSHIPVVLLTALSSVEQNIEGLRHGADDYIGKPFDVELLLARCAAILRNRRTLQRKFFTEPASVAVKELATNHMDEQFIDRAIRLINDNIRNEKLDVTFLCRELSLSRTALFAKLKGITGQTPNDLIGGIKLNRAAILLLRHPEMSVTEISELSGFNSIQYFGKAFKARYNLTPSEYRIKNP